MSTVRRLQLEGSFLADYRDLRIQLWPDCMDDADRELAETLANPARWAAFAASLEGRTAFGFLEVSLRDYAEGANNSSGIARLQ